MKLFSFKHKSNSESMSLGEHLRELRNRLLIVFVVFIIAFLTLLPFAARLSNMFLLLGKAYGYTYIYLAPQELLLVQLNIVFFFAIALSLPCFIYHAYRFCAPALNKQERRGLILSVFLGFLFFAIGLLFALTISLPFMLRFLIQFTDELDVSASIRVSEYISFVTTIFIVFGVIFELPVISLLLTRLGLIKANLLIKARKIMIVIIFIVAAIITPPDVISQIMVALPMIALYELSIIICKISAKKS